MSTKEFSNSFSLTDEIADIVRERILKGEYEIGEKIKENFHKGLTNPLGTCIIPNSGPKVVT